MAYLDACQGNKWIGDEGGALMLATARDTEENHFVFSGVVIRRDKF
jgi:hypothetical protein